MEILTLEDFKDTKLDPTWGHFDYLLEIARVDQKKLEKPSIKARNDGEEKEKRPWHDDQGFLKYFLYNTAPAQPQALMFNQDQNYMGFKKQRKSLNNVDNAGVIGIIKRKRKHREEDEDEEWNQRPTTKILKKSKKVMNPSSVPDLPGNVKQHIVENMGGSELGLVIQKTIYFSDINPAASRLTMPFSQLKTHEFLTKAEAEDLKNVDCDIKVCLLMPAASMKENQVTFKRWNYQKRCSSYVFNNGWNSVAESNGLKAGDIVQVWSFRAKSNLCFALVKVQVPMIEG